MDFDRLRSFYQVVCEKSITRAARTLGVDKSSVSRQLTQLEKELGQKLILREGNSLEPTEKGHLLFDRARIILNEIEATRQAIQHEKSSLGGSLRVTTTHALISTWLAGYLPAFLEENPEIRLEVFASNQEIKQALYERDVAIRPFCPNEEWLIQKHLKQWRLYLYATPEYLERFGTPTTLEELDHHRLILFCERTGLYPTSYAEWPVKIGAKIGRAIRPFFVTNSLHGVASLVQQGVGMGYFHEGSPLLEGCEVVKVLPDLMYRDVDAYFIYPEEFQGFGNIEAFETFLHKCVKDPSQEIKLLESIVTGVQQ